jgi:hypothetical protein
MQGLAWPVGFALLPEAHVPGVDTPKHTVTLPHVIDPRAMVGRAVGVGDDAVTLPTPLPPLS